MTADSQPDQRSPEWYEARKGRVTGSVAGAILNLDPNKKRADVLRRMVRDSLGAESEASDNIAIEYGRHNEDGAAIEFQMETGLKLTPAPFLKYEDWLGASPDGFTSDGGVAELKCPFSRRKRHGEKAGQEPDFKTLEEQPQYYAQMQIEMLCAGAGHAWFYQWSALKTSCERVEFNQSWLDQNLPALRQFYSEYLDTIADPDLAAEHLAPRRVLIDTPEAHKAIREWDEIAEQMELLAERKKDLLADMVAQAGGKNADFAGRKLTLTKKQGAISYAAVVKKHCSGVNLEPFRGKPSESWGVR